MANPRHLTQVDDPRILDTQRYFRDGEIDRCRMPAHDGSLAGTCRVISVQEAKSQAHGRRRVHDGVRRAAIQNECQRGRAVRTHLEKHELVLGREWHHAEGMSSSCLHGAGEVKEGEDEGQCLHGKTPTKNGLYAACKHVYTLLMRLSSENVITGTADQIAARL